MWTDESQERVVERRQERLQQNLDAASELPVDPPAQVMAAANALALKTQEELTEPARPKAPPRPVETWAQKQQRWVEEWRREHEELRLHQHRKLGRVVANGLADMEERLEKGEPVVDETGSVIGFRPLRTRDLDNIISNAIDKQLALEKRILGEDDGPTTSIPGSVTSLLERLELLAKANPVNGKVHGEYREPKVIDVEPGE